MKKTNLIILLLVVGIPVIGFSQTTTTSVTTTATMSTAPADFFAGKWAMEILGTPNGDAKFTTDLVRKDGKLTGQLADSVDPSKEKINITSITEEGTKLTLAFTAQGYDVTMELAKVDDDNLKGSVMGMFDASAKRLK